MAPKRNYKLLSDNTKGVKVYNIIIADSLELNVTGCFYKYAITHLYNFNTCLFNISK